MKKNTIKIEIIAGVSLILLLLLYVTLSLRIQSSENTFQVNVFEVGDGFGYNIIADNHVLIKQENIPSIQQQRNFISYEHAEKVAYVMVEKLNKGANPSVTIEELKKLGILSAISN